MTIILKEFLTKDSFAAEIERLVHEDEMTYFEAVIHFATECDKDPEDMVPFFSQVIMDKVRKSATDMGFYTSKEPDLENILD